MKKETMTKLIELRNYVDVLNIAGKKEICNLIDQIFICEMNDQRVGNFDLYKLAEKKETYGEKSLTGVYHANGYKYVTNRAILCKTKESYSEELEGRVLLSDGSLLPQENTRVPRFDAIIPSDLNDYVCVDVDFDKVALWSKEAKVHKKNYGKSSVRFVNIYNGINSSFDFFKLFTDAMRAFEISKIMVHSKDRTKFIIAKNDSTILILCPNRASINEEYDEYTKWFNL